MDADLTALSTKKNGLASLRILTHSYIELNRYSLLCQDSRSSQPRGRPLGRAGRRPLYKPCFCLTNVKLEILSYICVPLANGYCLSTFLGHIIISSVLNHFLFKQNSRTLSGELEYTTRASESIALLHVTYNSRIVRSMEVSFPSRLFFISVSVKPATPNDFS